MPITDQAQRLDTIFDAFQVALQNFDAAVSQHPAGSPALAAALAEFQSAWQHFLTQWDAALGHPFSAPSAMPLALLHPRRMSFT